MPTSYEDVVDGIQAYWSIAHDEGLPESDIYVRLTECFTGGFEVVTGIFNLVSGVGDKPGSCKELTMYVTPDVARRLLEADIVRYVGRYDTFNEACLALASNALPHDLDQFVLAYDSWHPAISFDEASTLIASYTLVALELGDIPYIVLAPMDIGYEIVAFISVEPGVLGDSDYVSDIVAQRLVNAGLAKYMELAK